MMGLDMAREMLSAWGGGDLRGKVGRYAKELGKPVDEVLLSLLRSALGDLELAAWELSAFEDPNGFVGDEIEARDVTQRWLSEHSGLSKAAVNKYVNRKSSPTVHAVRSIVTALEEL